jgi:hypothetical protein
LNLVANMARKQAATALASRGGTALPICLAISIFDPSNAKSSGNDWSRAAGRSARSGPESGPERSLLD